MSEVALIDRPLGRYTRQLALAHLALIDAAEALDGALREHGHQADADILHSTTEGLHCLVAAFMTGSIDALVCEERLS